jgi:hypothetical protein
LAISLSYITHLPVHGARAVAAQRHGVRAQAARAQRHLQAGFQQGYLTFQRGFKRVLKNSTGVSKGSLKSSQARPLPRSAGRAAPSAAAPCAAARRSEPEANTGVGGFLTQYVGSCASLHSSLGACTLPQRLTRAVSVGERRISADTLLCYSELVLSDGERWAGRRWQAHTGQ